MGTPFPGPWRFTHHPWAREVHDARAEKVVVMKAAQMAFTETALNRVFFNMDVRKLDCLYLLPASKPDAADFSVGRFDPAISLSPQLTHLFSNVKNVNLKQAGAVNLYVRGSRSEAGLKSIPVSIIIFDELDEMAQKNIPLAEERASGQLIREFFYISTPTIPNYGISARYDRSTQEIFTFKCPLCSRHTDLSFPDCLVMTAESIDDPKIKDTHLICKECQGILPHESKVEWLADGIWRPTNESANARGFSISQLYSMTVQPWKLTESYLKAQTNAADEQEFYNSKLGVPHIVDGASLSIDDLDSCIHGYRKEDSIRKTTSRLRTMGVDVGKLLHVEIDEWIVTGSMSSDLNVLSTSKVILERECKSFDELDQLMRQYQVNMCVIDAQPERRKAKEFADRFPGHVKMCQYARGVVGKDITVSKDPYNPVISVDRTSWLDLSQGRFLTKSIMLPVNTSDRYKKQLQTLVRRLETDPSGNPVARYFNTSDDHFAHARNYAEIALPLAASITSNTDVKAFL